MPSRDSPNATAKYANHTTQRESYHNNSRPEIKPRRFAVAVVVCDGQVPEAGRWLQDFESVSKITRESSSISSVAIVPEQLLLEDGARALKSQGWGRIIPVSRNEHPVFNLRYESDSASHRKRMWVQQNHAQLGSTADAAACSVLKLMAWNCTEYDGMLVSDLHVRFLGPLNLLPFFEQRIARDSYFEAKAERASRRYDGLNTDLFYLTPSTSMAQILLDKARSGDFVPYIHTEQDILETTFSPHTASTAFDSFPPHVNKAATLDSRARR